MATETTLIEELEQAVLDYLALAGYVDRQDVKSEMHERAARLRARAERVRAAEGKHTDVVGKAYDEAWQDCYEELCGSLPSDTTREP